MISFEYKDWANKRLVQLLDLYKIFPFHLHPLWQAVLNQVLTKDQIILAETQHYLRTKAGQPLRKIALDNCALNPTLFNAIIETYIEECVDSESNVNHLSLIKRILHHAGLTEDHLGQIKNTPGNIAAIALYKNIGERGAGCHIIGAGVVEYYYSQLSPHIFESYTKNYNFPEDVVETYRLHGPMDQIHASRAFDALDECVNLYGWDIVVESVRDAFVATSLHYDGMLQAATNINSYWNGK